MDMFNQFTDPEYGDEHEFLIQRGVKNDKLSFSSEALEKFKETINLFIGGRLVAFWTKTGNAPQKVKVSIKVEIE